MASLIIPLNGDETDEELNELKNALENIGLTEIAEFTITDDSIKLGFGNAANNPDNDMVNSYIHQEAETPSLELRIPLTNRSERADITKAENTLAALGVNFNTRTQLYGNNPTWVWELNWSLSGAHVSLNQDAPT